MRSGGGGEKGREGMIEVIDMKGKGLFVRISRTDAIKLIHSLSEQIIANSPNVGRWEPITKEGKEFTIAVIPESQDE